MYNTNLQLAIFPKSQDWSLESGPWPYHNDWPLFSLQVENEFSNYPAALSLELRNLNNKLALSEDSRRYTVRENYWNQKIIFKCVILKLYECRLKNFFCQTNSNSGLLRNLNTEIKMLKDRITNNANEGILMQSKYVKDGNAIILKCIT